MIRTSTLLKTGLISTALWLSACTIFPEATPQTRYNLPAAALQPIATTQNSTLYVALPQANRLINSNYILVQPNGTQMQSYKGAQWADTAPVLLRERFVQALTDAALFQAVTGDAALNTPLALEGYLANFEVQYQDGQPVIRIQYEGKVVDRQSSSIMRSQRFVISQPAAATDIDAVITAFGLAADELSLQVLAWLQQQ